MQAINKAPEFLLKHVDEVCEKLKFNEKLQRLYRNCYLNAYETTMMLQDDGSVFFITGDIHAMWNRDSAQQVVHYLPLAAESDEAKALVKGTIRRQLFNLRMDSYANAFNMEGNDRHYADTDRPKCGKWTWEQKYETDSISHPMLLAYRYYQETGDSSVFDEDYIKTVALIVDQFILEQRHTENSAYRHTRVNCPWQDTLQNGGQGYPVKYTGMTWQGFRPSDDATKFGYNIPGNMMVSVCLGSFMALQKALMLFPEALMNKIVRLKDEIDHGIEDFGIVLHPKYGKIYAYETDGYGNYVLADDANVPNLLSAPYLGFVKKDDPIYLNTRRFILSADNPYYSEGRTMKGLGSPHTPAGYIWHMGLCMQGMTASTSEEAGEILNLLVASDADTGYMHEGFLAEAPEQYTRDWFAASNSMFAEFVEYLLKAGMIG